MTTASLQTLQAALEQQLGDAVRALKLERGELTLTVASADYERVALRLRDDPALHFEQLTDPVPYKHPTLPTNTEG